MKVRSAAIQGGLAALGLVAAYATWQRPPSGAPGDVTVVDLPAKKLQRVKFEDGARRAVIEKSGDDYWVTIATPGPKPASTAPAAAPQGAPGAGAPNGGPAPAATDAGAVPAAAPEPAPVIVEKTFRGNESAKKLFERMAPLRASRALGKLDEKVLTEVGLTGTSRQLALEGDGEAHRFRVSKSQAGGFGSSYLQEERSGEVFLLASGPLSDLEAASSRLVDRRLHGWGAEQPDAFTVRREGKSRDFVSVPASDTIRAARWAPTQTPATPDELVTNWHERINRLAVVEVLGKGEAPGGGAPRVELRLEYARRGRAAGWLEVGKAGNDYFARSEHTAGWVRLAGNTGELLKEAEKVTGP